MGFGVGEEVLGELVGDKLVGRGVGFSVVGSKINQEHCAMARILVFWKF